MISLHSRATYPAFRLTSSTQALGFLANGYATGEFEVTSERLGVYSCVEHIDNPKVHLKSSTPFDASASLIFDLCDTQGYASDQPGGDARRVDPRLRGPVDPQELQIDPRTGMKVSNLGISSKGDP